MAAEFNKKGIHTYIETDDFSKSLNLKKVEVETGRKFRLHSLLNLSERRTLRLSPIFVTRPSFVVPSVLPTESVHGTGSILSGMKETVSLAAWGDSARISPASLREIRVIFGFLKFGFGPSSSSCNFPRLPIWFWGLDAGKERDRAGWLARHAASLLAEVRRHR